MGCGKTKHKQELIFELEEVKNENIDRQLQSLAEPLKILKECHDALDDSLDNLYYFTGTNHYLKRPTLESALKVFIFTVASAAHQSEHNLKQVIKFHKSPPFFVSDEQKMEAFAKQGIQECMEIIHYIKKLTFVLSEGPTKFFPIFESLQGINTDMVEKVKEEILNSSMNPFEKTTAVNRLLNNIGKISNVPNIAKKVKDDMENIIKD